ncbi:MAG: tRNA dihydrouridine(20/20a) synthase DusA [Gammaproteobacteria bacterium TMED134]|nr:MAG: tRNA dihydrouridine(20/20a) synthase DusA [Gammaproteobacteria bacterium TMED134]RZO70779.1 MAG: tRNA dihydrouridine(20/20a) synthase DusA [OM182 bacterium]|tara:strand:- start:5289 stop:6308 length:1020 start_codon:yes stop_codon:yes gene_type:complete
MNKIVSVAPMMAWTDKHCRHLHRLYSPSALLFTEMITTGALLHGEQLQLLDYDASQHPLAIQLGGNEPAAMAACAALAAERDYDEININAGCPSDRVQKGTFGACLMREPERVAACIRAMRDVTQLPITVKCRTGLMVPAIQEDFTSDTFLHDFVGHVLEAGCDRLYLHARIAVLGGLTPAQNRDVPPLTPEKGKRLKHLFPSLPLVLNGGLTEVVQCEAAMAWADGVMLGRAAYHQPRLLSRLEQVFFDPTFHTTEDQIVASYLTYVHDQLERGTPLASMTKHLLHCFNGRPGARRFRQVLSDHARLRLNDTSIIDDALHQINHHGADDYARQSTAVI